MHPKQTPLVMALSMMVGLLTALSVILSYLQLPGWSIICAVVMAACSIALGRFLPREYEIDGVKLMAAVNAQSTKILAAIADINIKRTGSSKTTDQLTDLKASVAALQQMLVSARVGTQEYGPMENGNGHEVSEASDD